MRYWLQTIKGRLRLEESKRTKTSFFCPIPKTSISGPGVHLHLIKGSFGHCTITAWVDVLFNES